MTKKTLLAGLIALACTTSSLADDYTYNFTTTNGFSKFDQINLGYYVNFSVTSASLSAENPSLTTISYNNTAVDDVTFDSGQSLTLSSITIIGRNTASSSGNTLPSSDIEFRVYEVGNVTDYFVGTWVENIVADLTSVTNPELTQSNVNQYIISFGDDAVINLNQAYTIKFYNTTTNKEVGLSLSVVQGGDENFAVWTVNGYSNAMTIEGTFTSSVEPEYIPEPATASLSLISLAGLMLRRRRRSKV